MNKLKKTLNVAEKVGAKMYILVTLLPQIPDILVSAIEDFQEEYPNIAIHLANRDSLEKGYFDIPERMDYDRPLTVADLLPKRVEDNTGRDITPGERKIGLYGGTWSQTI